MEFQGLSKVRIGSADEEGTIFLCVQYRVQRNEPANEREGRGDQRLVGHSKEKIASSLWWCVNDTGKYRSVAQPPQSRSPFLPCKVA